MPTKQSSIALCAVIRKKLKRKASVHKGMLGRVAIIAGSTGMSGAACMCAEAALRAGAGLVTLCIPHSLHTICATTVTEVMTKPLPETKTGSLSAAAFMPLMRFIETQDVVAIGPGLSQHPQTKALVRRVITACSKPLVIDADGLNACVGKTEILAKIKSSVIMTPHIGEFLRLFEIDRLRKGREIERIARDRARVHKLILVLKSNNTFITDGVSGYRNKTGNPGLATGGSGDVLTGIIAAFCGQGMPPIYAAEAAVYIHGLAADIGAKEMTQLSLLPTDLFRYLPQAFKRCGIR